MNLPAASSAPSEITVNCTVKCYKRPICSCEASFYRPDSLSVAQLRTYLNTTNYNNHHTTTTVLRPFFRDHPGEPVPEENFCTLWCKGRLTEVDTLTIWLGATPSRLTSAHLHHPPCFFTGRMPFLPPNQQRQSTEGN